MANIQKIESLSEQSTTSTSFVDLTNGTLTFTPDSTNEIWMIFASGVMRSNNTAEQAATVQLTVNGTMKDYAQHQNNSASTPNGAGFVMMERVTGVDTQQTIKLQFKAVVGTTYVSDVRMVVAKVPEDADFQFTSVDASYQVCGSVYPMLSLTWTPSSSGNYIIMGKHIHHEYPSGTTSRSWFECQGVDFHPNSPSNVGYSNARDPWMPVFCAWRHNFAACSQTIHASLRTSNAGAENSEYGYPKLMAFREDAFDAAYYNLSAAQSTTTSTSYQTKNSIAVPAPPSAREFLSIQAARLSADDTGTSVRRAGELKKGGSTLVRTNHRINRNGSTDQGYHHLVGAIDATTESGAVTYENGYLSPDAATVQIAESSIIVLRYPAAETPIAANAPFYGMVA